MIDAAISVGAVIWVCVLLIAPALLSAHYRPTLPIHYAGCVTIVLAVTTGLVYLVGTFGVPARFVLIPVCGVLLLCLVAALVVPMHRRTMAGVGADHADDAPPPPTWAGKRVLVLTSLAIAVWTMAPALYSVWRSGLSFGPATAGNLDIFYYTVAANNLATDGLHNSGLLANTDLGELVKVHHVTVPVLLDLVSTVTSLNPYESATIALGVVAFITALCLWALAHALWPDSLGAVWASTVVGSLSALTLYNVAHGFIGAILATVSIATMLAVATELARAANPRNAFLLTVFVSAGVLGILGYPFICLPAMIGAFVWALFAALALGHRKLSELRPIVTWAGAGVIAVLVITSPILADAIGMMSEWATTPVGWRLTPLTPHSITIWPRDLQKAAEELGTGDLAIYLASWGGAAVVAAFAVFSAWRNERASALMAAVVVAGFLVVTAATVVIYGASYYNTWKMTTYLWPIVCAMVLPALWSVRVGPIAGLGPVPAGPHLLTGLLAITLLNPVLIWQAAANPRQTAADRSLREALDSVPEIAAVNIRLATLRESQLAAAELVQDGTSVSFEQTAYLAPTSSAPDTCTITSIDLLKGDEAARTRPLGGNYVLLLEPEDCRLR